MGGDSGATRETTRGAGRSDVGGPSFPEVSNGPCPRPRRRLRGRGVGTTGAAGCREIAIWRVIEKVGGEGGSVERAKNIGR